MDKSQGHASSKISKEAFTDSQKTTTFVKVFSLEKYGHICCANCMNRFQLTLSVDCPDGLSTLAFWCSRFTPSAFSALINTTNGQNCRVRRSLRACGKVKVTKLMWLNLGNPPMWSSLMTVQQSAVGTNTLFTCALNSQDWYPHSHSYSFTLCMLTLHAYT